MQAILATPLATAAYALRFAQSEDDVRAVQRLRFEVFNLELQEGLVQSHALQRDEDPFDAICDHLMVERVDTGSVVGTYRMQSGARAGQGLGYYCAQEFEFAPYEPLRAEVLELGRACIAREHRSMQVLGMLWRGIAMYSAQRSLRYLMGCSSLTSQDTAMGHAAFHTLRAHLAPVSLQTAPLPAFELPAVPGCFPDVKIPKLLSAYLALGAWICGPAAIDRSFGTIDFLTCLDLQSGPMAQRRKRFGVTG